MPKSVKQNLLIASLIALALPLLSFLLYFSVSYMGVRDREVEKILVGRYLPTIILFNLKIILFYFLFAAIIGLFALLLRIQKIMAILLFQLFFWFFFWIRAIKLFPQLFDDQLYHHGGLLKYFQIALTDYIPMAAIYILFVAILLAVAWKQKRLWGGLAILLLCFLFVIEIPVLPARATAQTSPNVLILGMDSLRPDRLSANGYFRPTPHIDQLLGTGGNCLNLISSLARTHSSFTSILTSTWPPRHDIRYMFPRPAESRQRWPNLVETLTRAGYETSVVSDFGGDVFAQLQFGFRHVNVPHNIIQNLLKQRSIEIHYFLQGFLLNPSGRLFFPEIWLMPLNLDPYHILHGTQQRIRQSVHAGKPFFILAFYTNCHFPYSNKYPYYRLYTQRGYNRPHKYRKMDNQKLYSGFDLPAVDKEQINGLYDGSVKMFDDQVGKTLRFLKSCKLERNTIVILLSDHGESLYENGYGTGHGDHLRGPYSNRMVFAVHSPFETFAGRQIAPTTRDIDIAPTILELLGQPPLPSFQGHSLLPYLRGQPFTGLPAYMETCIWFTPESPYIRDRIRIPYPPILKMLEIDPDNGEVILKKEFHDVVIRAKERAYMLNEKKYVYYPGENGIQEEFYSGENRVPREAIHDAEFLDYKLKIVEMFKDRFYLDSQGRIQEK